MKHYRYIEQVKFPNGEVLDQYAFITDDEIIHTYKPLFQAELFGDEVYEYTNEQAIGDFCSVYGAVEV